MNMKTFTTSFLFALFSLVAKAEAVEINGIYYNLISKSSVAEVTINPNRYKGSVIIPERVRYKEVDYDVKTIGSRAFANCGDLSSIVIPSTVTTIGNGAFNRSGISSVILPEALTSIGDGAFENCKFKGGDKNDIKNYLFNNYRLLLSRTSS